MSEVGRKTPRLRRMVLVFLAFAYLFVGLAHSVACVEQAVAATVVVDTATTTDGFGRRPPEAFGSGCGSLSRLRPWRDAGSGYCGSIRA